MGLVALRAAKRLGLEQALTFKLTLGKVVAVRQQLRRLDIERGKIVTVN